jgi:two-component system, response regulator YesN
LKVLIVDDEPLEREVLMDIVKKSDLGIVECIEVENGADAVEIMNKDCIDIVVMDIRMPVMDGITAAKLMKQDFPNLKIVFLTAYNEFDYALQTIKIGVEDFLLKPVRPEEFIQTLEKVTTNLETDSVDRKLPPQSNSMVDSVIEYIGEHLEDKLTLQQLADYVYLHPQYLSRLFKQEKGITITEFITMKRIEKSKSLLISTQESITDISEKCGFTDLNYFSRVFSKIEGVSPKKYRQYEQTLRKEKKNQHYFNKIM